MVAEARRHHVAPLDQHDPVELGELVERQIGDLGRAVQPVQVGMVERDLPSGRSWT